MLSDALKGAGEKVSILLESFAMLDRFDQLCGRRSAAKIERHHRCTGTQMDFVNFSGCEVHGNQATSSINYIEPPRF